MVTAIVLAAGLSSRMGQPKPLLPFGERAVITHILTVLEDCPVDEILVITGHERASVERLLADRPVRIAFNPHYATGEMLSSIQTGLRTASVQTDAALVVLGDQPTLEARVVEQIIAAYRQGRHGIVIPSYRMRRGHPILIAREHWDAILALNQPQTLRDFFRSVGASTIHHVDVTTPSVLDDMDTPADYARVLATYSSRDQNDAKHLPP